MTTVPTLYLAFDGVLHPNLVSFHQGCPPRLRAGGHTLFENNAILEHVVDVRPSTVVVLHSWWVQIVGYQGALRLLPESVRPHVIGSTWRECRGPRARMTNNRSRRDWLQNDLVRRQPAHPVLLDCDARQVVPQLLDSTCIVDAWRGLTDPGAWDRLVKLLMGEPEPMQIAGPSSVPRLMQERLAA